VDRCVTGQCYWALLHLVVVVTGICGALEATAGEATKAGYIDWCQRVFPPAPPAPLRAEAGDVQHQLLGRRVEPDAVPVLVAPDLNALGLEPLHNRGGAHLLAADRCSSRLRVDQGHIGRRPTKSSGGRQAPEAAAADDHSWYVSRHREAPVSPNRTLGCPAGR
jgi:hypothetical protein